MAENENVVIETESVETESTVAKENAVSVEGDYSANVGKPNKHNNKFLAAVDNYFGITAAGSNFKREIIAGITTFMAMAYILIVNPSTMKVGWDKWNGTGDAMIGALYIATCLGAIIGTLIMAIHAKMPFALAPGMGLNAYFAYTIVGGDINPYTGLFIILCSGLLFLLLTVVGVREKIVAAIPAGVKAAIPAGIGLFIAFVGLQNAKIIQANGATLVQMADLNFLRVPFSLLFPMIVTFITFMIIVVLAKLKVKGGILWGILAGTALYYIIGYAGAFFTGTDAQIAQFSTYIDSLNVGVEGYVAGSYGTADAISGWLLDNGHTASVPLNWALISQNINPADTFSKWGTDLVGQLFVKGFDFGELSGDAVGKIVGVFISAILAFAMVDMFDTIGTLLGTAKKANMLDKDGNLPNMKKALFADSVATCTGAIFGTTTVTTFVESSAGVAEGGRTGFTSLIVALLFFVALFLSPIAYLIPSCATAAALIYVGVLMISSVVDIDFSDVSIAVPAFLTISMMALTYNISFGIGLGLISHCMIQLCTGRYFKTVDGKKCAYLRKDLLTIILAILFICNFIFVSH